MTMSIKGSSGINRGGVKADKKAPVAADKKYAIESRIEVGKHKKGIQRVSKSEGFKAIYDAPENTRFSVNYIFGGGNFNEVRLRGGGTKVIQPINSDGRPNGRYRTIRSPSDVKRLFKNAKEIIIHGVR